MQRRALQIHKENTSGTRPTARASRDDKKPPPCGDPLTSGKHQKDEAMEGKAAPEDVYEFKAVKDGDSSPDDRKIDAPDASDDPLSVATSNCDDGSGGGGGGGGKRGFADVGDPLEESGASAAGTDDESRRKKRKEENAKEGKSTTQRNAGQTKGQNSKQSVGGAPTKSNASGATKGVDKKSPCASPRPSEGDGEDGKSDLKVPPLKIVIPQTGGGEQEAGAGGRNGKGGSQRTHQALPYVVASSSSSDAGEGIATTAGNPEAGEEKKEGSGGGVDEAKAQPSAEPDGPSGGASSSAAPPAQPPPPPPAPPVELHPRKRKMKQSREPAGAPPEPQEPPSEAQVHPHEQPITNCYRLYLNIRKQISKRRRGLFPVQPKPPQGFKDYLMNRCTYVLAGTAPTTPNIVYPPNLPQQMKDLFTDQEKERYRLRTQHVIEKEKLVLSVEQEILRVHGRAARALANQSLPFSVCTILRDEEVYNLITPEQEEKDRNARSRYNGRLFLSWLQDVDDKWEKIKEGMLLRHHNEAESLHAVQKMDWEWKMKELSLCDRKITPKIDETHVPMVHVSDDFDLLPA